MSAKGKVGRPLDGVPALVAVEAGTYEIIEPDRKGIGEGVERQVLAGLVARKAATYQPLEPDREKSEGRVESPSIAGRGMVLGFLDASLLEEIVKWERVEEEGTVIETGVVEGLAVIVRDVEGEM